MPSALTFDGNVTKGIATDVMIGERQLQFQDRKFWGVSGVSSIYGEAGERMIAVAVTIFDENNADFDTAEKLSDYIDTTLDGRLGDNGQLEIHSESDHDPFTDVTFLGVRILDGPKPDICGTMGGGYWADCIFTYKQLS